MNEKVRSIICINDKILEQTNIYNYLSYNLSDEFKRI
jgi:hypothetical protein